MDNGQDLEIMNNSIGDAQMLTKGFTEHSIFLYIKGVIVCKKEALGAHTILT